jgi:hypothetical protein
MELATVQTILRLNNTAAAYFHCGSFEEATQLFRIALATSRKVIVAVENDIRNGSSTATASHSSGRRQQGQSILNASALEQSAPLLLRSPELAANTTATQHLARAPACLHQQVNGEQDKEDFLEFVYTSPMTMQEREFLDGSISYMSLALICTFNLALTLHAKEIIFAAAGRPTSPTSTIRLYELSYSLLVEHEQQDEDYLCGKIWLVSFAILNNLGVLHKQFGSHNKSRATFEMLLSMLLYRREQHQAFTDEQALNIASTCAIMEGFYSNALTELGVLSQSITAASA